MAVSHPRSFSRVKHFLRNVLGMTEISQSPNLSQTLLYLQAENPLPGEGMGSPSVPTTSHDTAASRGTEHPAHTAVTWRTFGRGQAEARAAEPGGLLPRPVARGHTSPKTRETLNPPQVCSKRKTFAVSDFTYKSALRKTASVIEGIKN